jgi:hypothetical protein
MTSAYEPVTVRFDWEQKSEHVDKDTTHVTRKFELVKSLHPMSNFIITSLTRHSTKHGDLQATLKYGDQLSHEMALKFARKFDTNGKYEIEGSLDAAAIGVQQKVDEYLMFPLIFSHFQFKSDYEYDYPRRVHAKLAVEAIAGGDEKSMEFSMHQSRHGDSGHFNVDAEFTAKYAAKDINWRVFKDIKQTVCFASSWS